ncbi:hypothetical protein PG994_012158 [Apiospora phragmitis]|uniref:Uncharacterized protein n=1 Tax=Apiospora phragmitis TaxID=2905665 RepID=A0ABR1TUW9_9PEZI
MAKQRKDEGAAVTRRQPRRAAKDAPPTTPPNDPAVAASIRHRVSKAPRKRRGRPGKQLPTEAQTLETMGVIREEPKEEKEGSEKQKKKHKKPPGNAAINVPKSQAGVQKASKRGPGRPRKMLTTAQAIPKLGVKFEEGNNEENGKSKNKKKEKKYMVDDPILREEKEEGLQRSLRWLPVWDSYSSLNAYMCAVGCEGKYHTHAEEEEEGEDEEEDTDTQQQPLKRPTGVPEPLWHAYHSFDDWMFRKCLTPEEVLMLPLGKTVDKAWLDAPNGFKYIAEDVLVFDDPEKFEGTAFEYKLTDCHMKQLKSGRGVSMGRRPSQSPDIDLGTFLLHDDLAMNEINSDLAVWV